MHWMPRFDQIISLIAVVIFLVTSIAHCTAYGSTTKAANGRAFKRATRLVADDAAQKGTADSTRGRTALCVRAGRGTAASEECCSEDIDRDKQF